MLPRCPVTAIGNAYAVLSNPEKRKQYDQFGDEKLNPTRHGHSHSDFHRGFEADISPEDLFNMFFGGGFPSSEHLKPSFLVWGLMLLALERCSWGLLGPARVAGLGEGEFSFTCGLNTSSF